MSQPISFTSTGNCPTDWVASSRNGTPAARERALRITGGSPLHGDICVSGSKNAALPEMAAALLTDRTLTLTNLPHLADITTMANLLGQHGVDIRMDGVAANGGHSGRALSLTTARVTNTTAPYDLVRKMRASVLVLGPLVARFGHARVSLPGGCAIGARPINLHLKGLEHFGASIRIDHGYVEARADGLKGAPFTFDTISVTGTENLMMAAVLAQGETILENAAREPEIQDLARMLNSMGARVAGGVHQRLGDPGVGHRRGGREVPGALGAAVGERGGERAVGVAALGRRRGGGGGGAHGRGGEPDLQAPEREQGPGRVGSQDVGPHAEALGPQGLADLQADALTPEKQ